MIFLYVIVDFFILKCYVPFTLNFVVYHSNTPLSATRWRQNSSYLLSLPITDIQSVTRIPPEPSPFFLFFKAKIMGSLNNERPIHHSVLVKDAIYIYVTSNYQELFSTRGHCTKYVISRKKFCK